jgi:hypothetical protein
MKFSFKRVPGADKKMLYLEVSGVLVITAEITRAEGVEPYYR